jgi:hypothetical protein
MGPAKCSTVRLAHRIRYNERRRLDLPARIAASGDFDDYWQFHLAKEHERTHQSRYAGGVIPNPLQPKRPRLSLVK